MTEPNALNAEFLQACDSGKFDQARALVAQGADLFARDENGTAMHHAVPYIAIHWPRTRPQLEALLEMGLSLNWNRDVDGAYGTPLHQLGRNCMDPNVKPYHPAMCAFLSEAIHHYGADLSLVRYFKQSDQNLQRTVVEDFMNTCNQHALPVMHTLLTHWPHRDAAQEDRIARKWSELVSYSGAPYLQLQALLECGLNGLAMDIEKATTSGLLGGLDRVVWWNEQNPPLSLFSIASKAELLDVHPSLIGAQDKPELLAEPSIVEQMGYNASPLLNPVNWRNMKEFAEVLAEKGDPLTAEDLLAPRIDGATMLEVGVARCGQAASVMALCAEVGVQLGVAELLNAEGEPSNLLQAFIDRNQVCELFTEENWLGKPKSEIRRVFDAIPTLQQEQVRNFHSLASGIDRLSRAQRALG